MSALEPVVAKLAGDPAYDENQRTISEAIGADHGAIDMYSDNIKTASTLPESKGEGDGRRGPRAAYGGACIGQGWQRWKWLVLEGKLHQLLEFWKSKLHQLPYIENQLAVKGKDDWVMNSCVV
ncbi:hypothetical protein HO173_012232 [Letharia columbiana]|uniref:Uncharacterized protein n=1 Tax=Letharia columbiana TaxID=112416 RepID=A0A8H6CQ03_9LECA|nr:uncharacterized protein HO173_012232 [Letharia columbiana]KAF6227492.1 hypothetical protein HO173_012232 [Letharia columbiana]